MGSMDKAFKSRQRLHRERVNVLRKGFLERKKDYKVRAAEFNRRQTVITKLRKKTLDKNPNEFYFHMKNSHVVDGVHYDKRKSDNDQLSPEELKLMQTQDLNYINYKRSIDQHKIERLKSELHLIDESKPLNKHTFFVDNQREKQQFNISQKLQIDPKLLKMGFNFANPSALKSLSVNDIKASNKVKALKYRQLENKIKREEFLKTLGDKMQKKKEMLNNNKKKKANNNVGRKK